MPIISTFKLIQAILLVTLCLLGTPSYEQVDSISVNPKFELGQQFVLKVSESQRIYDNKDLIGETENEYGIKVTVKEKNENGYLLEMDHRDFLFFNEQPGILERINHLDKGLVIQIQTDEFGTLENIKNWEDLRDQVHKMLDDIRITLGYNPDLVANFDTLKTILSTENKLRDHFIEEGQLWLLANGLYFEKGEVFKVPAMLPTLFSNDSIPAVVSIGLKKIEQERAHIFYLQTFEQDDVEDFLIDEMAFFDGFDLEFLLSSQRANVFMQHETDIEINTETHVCEKYLHRVVVKINDHKSVARMTVEIKEIK